MHRPARLALVALVLAAGCDRQAPLDPTLTPSHASADLLGTVAGAVPGAVAGTVTGVLTTVAQPLRLVDCGPANGYSATATIGPDGGTLAAGRYRVDFPAGAVASPQTFTLTVPSGRNVEIDVRADGYEHFWFAAPVTVTLDVARCGVLPTGAQVWNVDEVTKAPLEAMGGVVDALTGTMQFQTLHFSGYTIAW